MTTRLPNCIVSRNPNDAGLLLHEGNFSQPGKKTHTLVLQIPLRMTVDAISFSAHADFPQTSEFIGTLAPPHVVLVRQTGSGTA